MDVTSKLHAPAASLPREGPHWPGGWVGITVGLEVVVVMKISSLPLSGNKPPSPSP